MDLRPESQLNPVDLAADEDMSEPHSSKGYIVGTLRGTEFGMGEGFRQGGGVSRRTQEHRRRRDHLYGELAGKVNSEIQKNRAGRGIEGSRGTGHKGDAQGEICVRKAIAWD